MASSAGEDSVSVLVSGSMDGDSYKDDYPELHLQRFGGLAGAGGLPEGKTSAFWAIFLVVNAALGAGLLVFPLSFYMTGGIVGGILIELVRGKKVITPPLLVTSNQ